MISSSTTYRFPLAVRMAALVFVWIVALQGGRAQEQDDLATTLTTWQQDAQLALTRTNDPAAVELLPEGVRSSALATRRRDLEQTLLAIGRYEKAAASTPELHRAVEISKTTLESWIRFDDPPPFSILKFDALQNLRDTQFEKKTSLESSIAIMERARDNLLAEEQAAGETLRRRNSEADRGGLDAAWHVESARIQNRMVQVRRAALRATLENLRLQLETAENELALTDRQIAAIEKQVAITEEDVEAITQASQQRQKNLRDELTALYQRQRKAGELRDRALEAREKAYAAEQGGTPSDALALAVARAQAAETTTDALQLMSEAVEWLLQIEAYHLATQNDRQLLLSDAPRVERADAEDSLRVVMNRLQAWEIVTTNELNAVAAELANVETRLSALPEGDARIPIIRDERAILIERQAAVQRVARAAAAQGRQLNRWINQYETRDRPISERIGDSWGRMVGRIRSVLGIEIFHYQRGDGEDAKRAVTLGKLLTALLLFLIPYLVARIIVRRIQRASVAMQWVGAAQGNTLGNWLGFLVAIPLALFALNFLDIPLTVFAFLGGALVIGLGFGMQTIIKNFISGIIVLFERRVRVGDIVEVEASSGCVTEINTRSSIIRNGDGIETLIPNSLFLENRVTNLTLNDRLNRRVIRVAAAYDTPPALAMDALRECVDRHGLVLKNPEPLVLFEDEDLGYSALMFAVYFWVEFNERTNAMLVTSDLRIMIRKRFAELGIAIPFPQRDLNFASDKTLNVRITPDPPAAP